MITRALMRRRPGQNGCCGCSMLALVGCGLLALGGLLTLARQERQPAQGCSLPGG